MAAVLCRHFGLQHIEVAEDIASDTFLKASEHWAINGLPENPTVWLSYYSIQKTLINAIKRSLFTMKDTPAIKPKINTQIWQDLLVQEKVALATK